MAYQEMTESTLLDTKSIESGDMHYVARLFLDYLSQRPEQNGMIKYYYQYEYDSNQTLYEKLMGSHQICISSRSFHEAKLINAILRVLIDDHTRSLEKYISLYKNMHSYSKNIPPLTVTNFFVVISNSDCLSEYESYCTNTLKEIIPTIYRTYTRNGSIEFTPDEIGPVRVFDSQTIVKILDRILSGDRSFDMNDRKNFILGVLTCASRS